MRFIGFLAGVVSFRAPAVSRSLAVAASGVSKLLSVAVLVNGPASFLLPRHGGQGDVSVDVLVLGVATLILLIRTCGTILATGRKIVAGLVVDLSRRVIFTHLFPFPVTAVRGFTFLAGRGLL